MRSKGFVAACIAAMLGGLLTSYAYVFAPNQEISLSEFVLCLSGREPAASLADMISLSVQFLPLYIFCAFAGIRIYRHFCTASVYVFSRETNRIRWYIHEVLQLIGEASAYQIVFIGTAMAATAGRLPVRFEQSGLILLGYHFLIHTLWSCTLILTINAFSVYLGSDFGYAAGLGIQMLLLAALPGSKTLEIPICVAINPISRLVMSWHDSSRNMLNSVLHNTEFALNINVSVCYMAVLFLGAALALGMIMTRHDLLISDRETGGV